MHWCRTGLEPFLYDNEGSACWGGKGNLANINFLKLKHTHTHTECTRGGERGSCHMFPGTLVFVIASVLVSGKIQYNMETVGTSKLQLKGQHW